MMMNHELKLLQEYKEKGFVSPIELFTKAEISIYRLHFNKLENQIGQFPEKNQLQWLEKRALRGN